MAKRFTEISSAQMKKTLAHRFIPLADSLRDMLSAFGLRSYKVAIIRVEWTGGKRGRGTPVILSEKTILPTPKLESVESLAEVLQPVGLEEQGSLELSQVSGTFSEEDLRGYSQDGEGIPANHEFFYEITFISPSAGEPQRRRFFPASAPVYSPGKLQWSMRLQKANEDRARNGDSE
jgi:hypothetical protein